jgi:two-component system sensor histidine kinase KdpD
VRCLLRDIRDRRANDLRLEEAAHRQRDSAARLREMDDVKNAFLLAVSHDLRGPLAAIVMLAQLLADRPDQPPQRLRRMAASIAANTARVERVQANLLDLDRLARHAVVLVRRSVGLVALVERAVAAADATDHPVSTRVEVAQAKLDAAVVERILDNLLSNVMAHTPRRTPVEISVVPWDQGVLLTVADHGPGIASERRRDVFKSFPSPTESPVASRTGMGLGLHLVARFAALHGGRVWVEETPGGGASFRVLLRDRA